MKVRIDIPHPSSGKIFNRELRGVDFYPEKRKLRAEFRPQVVGVEDDGVTPRTDEDSPAHDLRLQEMHAKMAWGDPDTKIDAVTRAHYSVRIFLFDKQRHVGTTSTPQAAGRLFDSALFHLWGWAKRPNARFNYYHSTASKHPPDFSPQVKELLLKLRLEARRKGLDPAAFEYTFSQRNDY